MAIDTSRHKDRLRGEASTQRQRDEGLLQRSLAKETASVLLPGRETAALALEHDLTLITRDRHFERIPQLPLESN